MSFNIDLVRTLGSMKCRNTKNYYSHDNVSIIDLYLDKYSAEKFNKTTGIEIQSQHWGGNIQLSIEGIDVEYFPISIDRGINEKN